MNDALSVDIVDVAGRLSTDVVTDRVSFGTFIVGIFKYIIEASGEGRRLRAVGPTNHPVITMIHTLRHAYAHDPYAVGEDKGSRQRQAVGRIFLALLGSPEAVSSDDWQRLQIAVMEKIHGLLTDIICCPGGDFCSLANARSIPVAEAIQRRFDDLDYLFDIGEVDLNISGCMNACGHHHVGHIGILGVEKNGEEFYQITIGGRADEQAQMGTLIGPAVPYAEVADVVEDIVEAYMALRDSKEELFIDTVKRLGVEPFKERVYATR